MGWVVRATLRPLDPRERDPALLHVYGSWVSKEEMHEPAVSSDSLVSVAVADSVSRGFVKLSRGFQAINLLCFTNTKRNL